MQLHNVKLTLPGRKFVQGFTDGSLFRPQKIRALAGDCYKGRAISARFTQQCCSATAFRAQVDAANIEESPSILQQWFAIKSRQPVDDAVRGQEVRSGLHGRESFSPAEDKGPGG